MSTTHARFSVGQLIHHRLFDYRGVVIDVDPVFQGTEEWYRSATRTDPPRDQPWYHVLVHDSQGATYVAERNLEPDDSGQPINHPGVNQLFSAFRHGAYVRQDPAN
jgi:heat shock protein HspQ